MSPTDKLLRQMLLARILASEPFDVEAARAFFAEHEAAERAAQRLFTLWRVAFLLALILLALLRGGA